MNVASLDLCKELYELSGWGGFEFGGSDWYAEWKKEDRRAERIAPKYDAGFLLRKLPAQTHVNKEYEAIGEVPAYYHAFHNDAAIGKFNLGAETPEDALTRLAIELFNAGVLKREEAAV